MDRQRLFRLGLAVLWVRRQAVTVELRVQILAGPLAPRLRETFTGACSPLTRMEASPGSLPAQRCGGLRGE